MIDLLLPLERSRLDPNDPRNAELLHMLESIPASSEETSHFRLVDVDSALRFMEDEEFEGDRRFTMLRSRHDGVGVSFPCLGCTCYSRCMTINWCKPGLLCLSVIHVVKLKAIQLLCV